MKVPHWIIVLVLLPAAIYGADVIQAGVREDVDKVQAVNFVQLLAHPDKYSERKVRFTAYVVKNGPDIFLFNSKEDMYLFRLDSAALGFFAKDIDLGFFMKEMNEKLITVEGLFKCRGKNSAPDYIGLITITYIRYQ
jgi:hypothetical protein